MSTPEIRVKILKINSSNLPIEEKNKLIQELMNPKKTEDKIFFKKSKIMHCPHYDMYTHIVSKCCNKVYPCRLCHDENEDHKINRHDIDYMKCIYCCTFQKVNSCCMNPLCFKFKVDHKYFCKKCNLWTDSDNNMLKVINSFIISTIDTKKSIYHCDSCGICRLGKREDFIHCDNCNLCLPKKTFEDHACKLNIKEENCPICLRSLWNTQNETTRILDCGHCVHSSCFIQNINSGNYSCSVCKKSMIDLTDMWRQIDAALESHSMPDEFKDWTADIHCNDCEKKTNTKYHFSYHKCQECGSYNTLVDKINKLGSES